MSLYRCAHCGVAVHINESGERANLLVEISQLEKEVLRRAEEIAELPFDRIQKMSAITATALLKDAVSKLKKARKELVGC